MDGLIPPTPSSLTLVLLQSTGERGVGVAGVEEEGPEE